MICYASTLLFFVMHPALLRGTDVQPSCLPPSLSGICRLRFGALIQRSGNATPRVGHHHAEWEEG
jgi:hypothetical protein